MKLHSCMEMILQTNIGDDNKHEPILILSLLLVFLSGKIENKDEIIDRTQYDVLQKADMKNYNR